MSTTMEVNEDVTISDGWLKRRKETFAMYFLEKFSEGLQFTMLYSTLWSYTTEGMHLKNPYWTYGLICAGRFICPICFNLVISRWFDIHRKLKLCAIIMNSLSSVGYILYILPFSPYLALAGTTLQGTGFILLTLMNSEILRAYKEDVIHIKFFMGMLAYGLGESIGPVFVKLMDKFDFWVGVLHIMYGNLPALFLLGLTLIKLVLTFFFVHDLSREYDLKSRTEHCQPSVARVNGQVSEFVSSLKDIFKIDILFLLVLQFYSAIVLGILPRIISLIMQSLHYSKLIVDLWFIGGSVSMVLTSAVISIKKPSPTTMYYCSVFGLGLMLLINTGLMIIKKRLHLVVNCIFLSIFAVGYGFCFTCLDTFIIVTIGKMCHSTKQTFVESIRMLVELSSAAIGALISAIAYQHIFDSSTVFLFFNVVLLICIVVRRKSLIKPQISSNTTAEIEHTGEQTL